VVALHVEDAAGDAGRLGAAEPHHDRRDVGGVEGVELLGVLLGRGEASPRFSVMRVRAAGAMALTVTP